MPSKPNISQQDMAAGLKVTQVNGLQRAGYSPEVAMRVAEQVADGKTLLEISKQEGYPSRNTLYRWMAIYPEFKKLYENAKEVSALSLEEEALELARELKANPLYTNTRIRALEVAMSQFRWSASHRDPRHYGQTSGTGPIVIPVQIISNLDFAGNGQTQAENIYTLEASVPAPAAETVNTEADQLDDIIDVEAEELPEAKPIKLPRNPRQPKPAKPKARKPRLPKRHKSANLTAITAANYAKRKAKNNG